MPADTPNVSRTLPVGPSTTRNSNRNLPPHSTHRYPPVVPSPSSTFLRSTNWHDLPVASSSPLVLRQPASRYSSTLNTHPYDIRLRPSRHGPQPTAALQPARSQPPFVSSLLSPLDTAQPEKISAPTFAQGSSSANSVFTSQPSHFYGAVNSISVPICTSNPSTSTIPIHNPALSHITSNGLAYTPPQPTNYAAATVRASMPSYVPSNGLALQHTYNTGTVCRPIIPTDVANDFGSAQIHLQHSLRGHATDNDSAYRPPPPAHNATTVASQSMPEYVTNRVPATRPTYNTTIVAPPSMPRHITSRGSPPPPAYNTTTITSQSMLGCVTNRGLSPQPPYNTTVVAPPSMPGHVTSRGSARQPTYNITNVAPQSMLVRVTNRGPSPQPPYNTTVVAPPSMPGHVTNRGSAFQPTYNDASVAPSSMPEHITRGSPAYASPQAIYNMSTVTSPMPGHFTSNGSTHVTPQSTSDAMAVDSPSVPGHITGRGSTPRPSYNSTSPNMPGTVTHDGLTRGLPQPTFIGTTFTSSNMSGHVTSSNSTLEPPQSNHNAMAVDSLGVSEQVTSPQPISNSIAVTSLSMPGHVVHNGSTHEPPQPTSDGTTTASSSMPGHVTGTAPQLTDDATAIASPITPQQILSNGSVHGPSQSPSIPMASCLDPALLSIKSSSSSANFSMHPPRLPEVQSTSLGEGAQSGLRDDAPDAAAPKSNHTDHISTVRVSNALVLPELYDDNDDDDDSQIEILSDLDNGFHEDEIFFRKTGREGCLCPEMMIDAGIEGWDKSILESHKEYYHNTF